jgi:hypothetical protein
MRSFAKSVLVVLALSLLGAVGCQRLNEERDLRVTAGDVKLVSIDGPRSEQKVKVEVTSSAPVDVYVVLCSEPGAEDKLLENRRPDPSQVLASQQQVETASLDATVPAKNKFCIVFKGAKKAADVKLKVTGR